MNSKNLIMNALLGTTLDTGLDKFDEEDKQYFVRQEIAKNLPIDNIDKKYLVRIAEIIGLGVEYLDYHRPYFQDTGLVIVNTYDPIHVKAGYVAAIIAAYIEVNDFYDLIEWLEGDFEDIVNQPFDIGSGASGYGEDEVTDKGLSLLTINDIAELVKFLDAGIAHFRVLSKAMRQAVPQLAVKRADITKRDPDGNELDLYNPNTMSRAASRGKGVVDITTVGAYQFERKYKNKLYQTSELADAERVPSREVLIVDVSPSMRADHRNTRAAVVLYDRLQSVIDGDAELIVIIFAGQPQLLYLEDGTYLIDTPEKAKLALPRFMDKCQTSSGSSTNVAAAIKYAVEIATKDDNRVDGEAPNIIIITDEASFNDDIDNKGCIINAVVAEENNVLKKYVRKVGGQYLTINRIPIKIALM